MQSSNMIEAEPSFAALVKSMRDAQKRYFRTRSTADLDKARALERAVDRKLEDMQTGDLFA